MQNRDSINQLFAASGGVLSTTQLNNAGYSYYAIKKLLKDGTIERIRHGWYRHLTLADNEWEEVNALVKDGVFCLHSSAQLHELSTFVSGAYQVAIDWKRRIRLPAYPPVKLYYWKDEQYTLGISQKIVDGAKLSVYDMEKTVCDFLKARNKLGLEAVKEVTQHYFDHPEQDINKLMRYARKLGIYSVARQYFELMV
ncbi:type IV toxin-antitoxin system AbiEi family antitoxin domain-containing protein [Phaeodactylibacter sp.]|jgi:predicted transcriptional regulator of viral defense system|uniref:type IV toxin-antitoxin system AbiEi family antitoxin domain-containing protein n=1 Tax=Phaeodactylibacter sp. TaxID=1940289 RepID=UPI0025EB2228|nr:type IV toxin-antitoxin system AbiEi family antitoxin domain-containing protein [Phaeodactylibacter sp.]MCI4649203.1 type IV toxin-antitoxin system AbiEi family antitoxin domain-containing protein [Phaeodactylibacter sp.]MCI5090342.1 type IV toxin-antitoxin system AbiEi family antitoxin domain-containing protein [Phaeodactylibacter sp.]